MRLCFGLQIAAMLGSLSGAAPLAAGQGFVAIVHPSNPVVNLSTAALRAIFSGMVTRWPNQTKIVLAQRSGGSAANQFLMDRLLRTSWQDYKRSLQALEFMGQEPAVVRVLNTPEAACKFVFNVPSAVSLIEASAVSTPECRDVKVLKVDGYLPGQDGYKLKEGYQLK